MRKTAGGNLKTLRDRWYSQPMFSNPPKIKFKWWKTYHTYDLKNSPNLTGSLKRYKGKRR